MSLDFVYYDENSGLTIATEENTLFVKRSLHDIAAEVNVSIAEGAERRLP